jgi:hypothetical protein
MDMPEHIRRDIRVDLADLEEERQIVVSDPRCGPV